MNTKTADIIGQVFKYGIGIIGAFFFIMILTGNYEEGGYIPKALNLSLWSIYLGAGIAILFGLYQYFTNFKDKKQQTIGLGVFIIILAVAYMMAKKQPVTADLLDRGVTSNQLLMTDSGLYTFYILLAVAILAIVYSEVSSLFK